MANPLTKKRMWWAEASAMDKKYISWISDFLYTTVNVHISFFFEENSERERLIKSLSKTTLQVQIS